MNYNYVNYQNPNSSGYANPNGQPAYGYAQNGQQNAYSGNPQRPPVTGQYAQYPHNVYSNPYPPPASSPQAYSHPMVVIPQRQTPSSHPSPAAPLQQPFSPAPHQQPQWQNYHQPQQPVQYQQFPQYLPNSGPPPPRVVRTQAMVEIPVSSPRSQQMLPSVQQVPQRKPSSSSTPARAQKPVPPPEPPVDYQLLLLSLAEEYIKAAHGIGSLVALYRRAEDTSQYYKLIATGLGCMESALINFRLLPRPEALLTLQYANIMFNETQNYDQIEKILSKGITLCDRNRLLDLKYSMHHLLARVLFKTQPRAALKSLDSLIPDVEAYNHVPWVYALRFLRVSLSLQLSDAHHDLAAASQHLRAISSRAESQGDQAVFITCATLEAMVHLRSSSMESVEHAQRAIASARSYQLSNSLQNLAQVWALLDCIDLACSLLQYNPDQASVKAKTMQQLLDELLEHSSWRDDDLFLVPVETRPSSLTDSTHGIFERADGKDHLIFSWMHKRDLYCLGFLLSGIAGQFKSGNDLKTKTYIDEGLKMLKENFGNSSLTSRDITPASCSLPAAAERLEWWQRMQWYLHLYMSTIFCNRSDWKTAMVHLEASLVAAENFDEVIGERCGRWNTYLDGVIKQGSGQTDAALERFQDPILALPQAVSNRPADARSDLCILAALNTLLIIRDPLHLQHFHAQPLMRTLEPFIAQSANKSLISAMHLVKSVLNPEDPIIEKKRSLQNALNNARAINNSQLLAVAMNVMTSMFFKDIVGDQAQKSTTTARTLAQRADSGLWAAVAGGMMAGTLDRQGRGHEAENIREDIDRRIDSLPDAVKEKFACT